METQNIVLENQAVLAKMHDMFLKQRAKDKKSEIN